MYVLRESRYENDDKGRISFYRQYKTVLGVVYQKIRDKFSLTEDEVQTFRTEYESKIVDFGYSAQYCENDIILKIMRQTAYPYHTNFLISEEDTFLFNYRHHLWHIFKVSDSDMDEVYTTLDYESEDAPTPNIAVFDNFSDARIHLLAKIFPNIEFELQDGDFYIDEPNRFHIHFATMCWKIKKFPCR